MVLLKKKGIFMFLTLLLTRIFCNFRKSLRWILETNELTWTVDPNFSAWFYRSGWKRFIDCFGFMIIFWNALSEVINGFELRNLLQVYAVPILNWAKSTKMNIKSLHFWEDCCMLIFGNETNFIPWVYLNEW